MIVISLNTAVKRRYFTITFKFHDVYNIGLLVIKIGQKQIRTGLFINNEKSHLVHSACEKWAYAHLDNWTTTTILEDTNNVRKSGTYK